MTSLDRLKKEFEEVKNSRLNELGYTIELFKPDNYYEWNITLIGAPDTSYANGIFHIKLSFPNDYPNKKPSIIFLTPIYHLNVCPINVGEPLGNICASFLNWWNPSTTAKEMLTQLYSIFYLPNPDSPYDLVKTAEFNNNRALYETKAKYFTKKYATQENFGKEYKEWNFSYIEENDKKDLINLIMNVNGQKIVKIPCDINEITKYALDKCKTSLGLKPEKNVLFIFNRKKLNLDIPIKENGLKENCEIIAIYDVIYA